MILCQRRRWLRSWCRWYQVHHKVIDFILDNVVVFFTFHRNKNGSLGLWIVGISYNLDFVDFVMFAEERDLRRCDQIRS